MKTCPVCGAKSFADMEVCFGCMHRFGEPEEEDFVEQPLESTPLSMSGDTIIPAAVSGGSEKESEEAKAGRLSCSEPIVLPACDKGYSLVISIQPA